MYGVVNANMHREWRSSLLPVRSKQSFYSGHKQQQFEQHQVVWRSSKRQHAAIENAKSRSLCFANGLSEIFDDFVWSSRTPRGARVMVMSCARILVSRV